MSPDYKNLFLDMMSSERGAARHTLDAYCRDLDHYLDFLNQHTILPQHAQASHIRGFIQHLMDEGLKPSSSARKLSAIRQFHLFLYLEGYAAIDPGSTIEGPKRVRPLPKTLAIDDVNRLFTTAQQAANGSEQSAFQQVKALRLLTLLELLYATGLRVSELVALPKQAARTKEHYLIIKGKGGRERLVPLTEQALQAAKTWLSQIERIPLYSGTIWLFPSDSETGHLTRQAFARDLKTLGNQAGLNSDLSPHVLRHAFASHLLQNGADLRIVQELLGHADISTTQIYTHVLDQRMKDMVRDLHPLNDKYYG